MATTPYSVYTSHGPNSNVAAECILFEPFVWIVMYTYTVRIAA